MGRMLLMLSAAWLVSWGICHGQTGPDTTQTWTMTYGEWGFTAHSFSPSNDQGGMAVACRELAALPTRWTFEIGLPDSSETCEDPRYTTARVGAMLVGGDCLDWPLPAERDYVVFDMDIPHGGAGIVHYRSQSSPPYTTIIDASAAIPDPPTGTHTFQVDRTPDGVWTLLIDGNVVGCADYDSLPPQLGTFDFINVYCSGASFRAYEPFYGAPYWVVDNPTVVPNGIPGLAGIRVEQNRPNPFNPETSIRFASSNDAHTQVRIYGVTGEVVRTLLDGPVSRGAHALVWDGQDDGGVPAASGTYFYRVQQGNEIVAKKMVLVR